MKPLHYKLRGPLMGNVHDTKEQCQFCQNEVFFILWKIKVPQERINAPMKEQVSQLWSFLVYHADTTFKFLFPLNNICFCSPQVCWIRSRCSLLYWIVKMALYEFINKFSKSEFFKWKKQMWWPHTRISPFNNFIGLKFYGRSPTLSIKPSAKELATLFKLAAM